jgi:hypothetical protein
MCTQHNPFNLIANEVRTRKRVFCDLAAVRTLLAAYTAHVTHMGEVGADFSAFIDILQTPRGESNR